MENNSLVSDGFDQDKEIAHLRQWLTKVESRPGKELLCRALRELMERDLLRYGLCQGEKGFGVIAELGTLESWALKMFYPSDPAGLGIVAGLCNPRMMLMNTGYKHGKPDLVFTSLLAESGGNVGTHRRRQPE